jgi:hypothetical protein
LTNSDVKALSCSSLIRHHNKKYSILILKGNTLNILCKATGTALIKMLKIIRAVMISTSFTVQVDAPLPVIDQDLKTIASKNISKSCADYNFCL